jgi:sugar transferase
MFIKDMPWYTDIEEHKRFMEHLAPIVLFTYNRLDHTRKTVKALQRNVYAKESVLYIYSDAPKTESAAKTVQAVRDYLRTINGFREVRIILREENWGLARNIMDGVTQIVNQYGKIIVLEDDIVTSKYFLKYMNDALEYYKNEKKVMMIHGHNYDIVQSDHLEETFFVESGGCWGWATWANAWKYFDRNPKELLGKTTKEQKKRINFDGAVSDMWKQVEMNADGRLHTWAVFWHASIVLQQGLALFPRKTLVRNVGFDGSGENCGTSDPYAIEESLDIEIEYFPSQIIESVLAREQMKKRFMQRRPTGVKSMIQKLCAFLRNTNVVKNSSETSYKQTN